MANSVYTTCENCDQPVDPDDENVGRIKDSCGDFDGYAHHECPAVAP
jgi:hypothetical protein